MRVLCRSGFISFEPDGTADIARLMQFFSITLVRENDYYTFPALKGLPRHSIKGSTYVSGLPATATYEGRHPWEVLKANGFVYNLALSKIVPKATINIPVTLPLVDDGYFLSQTPMFQPGSRNAVGQQILSYDAIYDEYLEELRLREYAYE